MKRRALDVALNAVMLLAVITLYLIPLALLTVTWRTLRAGAQCLRWLSVRLLR